MKKSFIVDYEFNEMRLDRWIRNNLGKLPQGLIEKNLRNGIIKVNKRKVKSSYKVKTNDQINIFNFEFKESIINKKIKFNPTKEIIKENENLIIDDNEDFIVLNKSAGISVQGGTKSKKNLVDIFAKSKIFQNTKTLISKLQDIKSANKVKKTLSKRYEKRKGGYTRIIKAGFRYGDNAPMAIIEFVDRDVEAKRVDKPKKDTTKESPKTEEKKQATA